MRLSPSCRSLVWDFSVQESTHSALLLGKQASSHVARTANKYPLNPFFCDCARRKTYPFNGSTVQKGKGVISVKQPESWVPAGDETGEE